MPGIRITSQPNLTLMAFPLKGKQNLPNYFFVHVAKPKDTDIIQMHFVLYCI